MYERDVVTVVLSEPASESTTISPPSSLSTATVTNIDSTEGNYSLLQKYSPVYVAAAIVMICALSLGLPSWLLLRYRRKQRTRQRSNDANDADNNHVISLRPSLPPRPTYNRSMASIWGTSHAQQRNGAAVVDIWVQWREHKVFWSGCWDFYWGL